MVLSKLLSHFANAVVLSRIVMLIRARRGRFHLLSCRCGLLRCGLPGCGLLGSGPPLGSRLRMSVDNPLSTDVKTLLIPLWAVTMLPSDSADVAELPSTHTSATTV